MEVFEFAHPPQQHAKLLYDVALGFAVAQRVTGQHGDHPVRSPHLRGEDSRALQVIQFADHVHVDAVVVLHLLGQGGQRTKRRSFRASEPAEFVSCQQTFCSHHSVSVVSILGAICNR